MHVKLSWNKLLVLIVHAYNYCNLSIQKFGIYFTEARGRILLHEVIAYQLKNVAAF